MKKIVRLTESDLARIVRRVLMENENDPLTNMKTCLEGEGVKTDPTAECAAFFMKVVAELPNMKPGEMPDFKKVPELMTDWGKCFGSMAKFPPDTELMENVTKFLAALPTCAMKNAGPQGGEELTSN